MIRERITKQFDYCPGEEIENADFVLRGGCAFSTEGVNLNYNAVRMDILLPELSTEGDVGLEGEKIIRDSFEKILLGQATLWEIGAIQPLPDGIRMCFYHEHAKFVCEESDTGLSFWEKRNAKKILELFDNYEVNVILQYSRHESCYGMSFCLTFTDSQSLVCFSLCEDCSKVEIHDPTYSHKLHYRLTWADKNSQKAEARKINAVITREFEF